MLDPAPGEDLGVKTREGGIAHLLHEEPEGPLPRTACSRINVRDSTRVEWIESTVRILDHREIGDHEGLLRVNGCRRSKDGTTRTGERLDFPVIEKGKQVNTVSEGIRVWNREMPRQLTTSIYGHCPVPKVPEAVQRTPELGAKLVSNVITQ
jgi:hypothetical protein